MWSRYSKLWCCNIRIIKNRNGFKLTHMPFLSCPPFPPSSFIFSTLPPYLLSSLPLPPTIPPPPLCLPILVSAALAHSPANSLSLSGSRKVKPPRRLMDENGIKMKAHFQIMKICGGRLGDSGRLPRCQPN